MNYSDIIHTLSDAGLDVALPGAKQDVCTSPYVVVQDAGTYPFAGAPALGYSLFTVHCYVPLRAYRQLPILIESVKSALAALAPDLRPTGDSGVHLINDKFRAHEGSVQYVILRRTILP